MNDTLFVRSDSPPIVAILRGITPEEAPPIAMSLIDAGIQAIEIPLNSPRPFDSIRALSAALSGPAMVGAGTVLKAGDVPRVADAGGRFVISPNTDTGVIRATRGAGLISIPGIFSPSEAFSAIDAGATALKVFPASVLGPGYFGDLRAVLTPEVPLFAVGGVNPGNVSDWFRAGAQGVAIGSALYKPGDTPTVVARRARSLVRSFAPVPSDGGLAAPDRTTRRNPVTSRDTPGHL